MGGKLQRADTAHDESLLQHRLPGGQPNEPGDSESDVQTRGGCEARQLVNDHHCRSHDGLPARYFRFRESDRSARVRDVPRPC